MQNNVSNATAIGMTLKMFMKLMYRLIGTFLGSYQKNFMSSSCAKSQMGIGSPHIGKCLMGSETLSLFLKLKLLKAQHLLSGATTPTPST